MTDEDRDDSHHAHDLPSGWPEERGVMDRIARIPSLTEIRELLDPRLREEREAAEAAGLVTFRFPVCAAESRFPGTCWTPETPPDGGDPVCTACGRGYIDHGSLDDPLACLGVARLPCMLDEGHDGPHVDRDGTEFTEVEPDPWD